VLAKTKESKKHEPSVFFIKATVQKPEGDIMVFWRGKGGREDLGVGLYQNYAGP
jgi:hypothetical protein